MWPAERDPAFINNVLPWPQYNGEREERGISNLNCAILTFKGSTDTFVCSRLGEGTCQYKFSDLFLSIAFF